MCRHRTAGRMVFFALLIGWWAPTEAADVAVYESLDDVQIGSVFFSPEDRDQLDKKRHRNSARKSHGSKKGAAAVRRYNSNAAGYIVGRSGREKVYYRGDFIAVAVRSGMTFPGDVKIIKSIPVPPSLTSDTGDENRPDVADEKD